MYVNKCIKCGREFETKNPKRVICPDCLYPDKKMITIIKIKVTTFINKVFLPRLGILNGGTSLSKTKIRNQ